MTASLFLTGATGLLGRGVLTRALRRDPALQAIVLVRDERRWRELSARLGALAERALPVFGELTRTGLGLDIEARRHCARAVTAVVHLAADTSFSRPLSEARAINTAGTANLLDAAGEWPRVARFAAVSTAFVAGRRTGRILEEDGAAPSGWVNGYEQSKHEAEQLVRAAGLPWIIFRPSTVVCDDVSGGITQYNAVHRALRLYHHGLAPMIPGTSDSTVDVVPADYVCDAIATLLPSDRALGRTFHLCAGDAALPLGELLDATFDAWSLEASWRRRGTPRPLITDLDTYRLFEASVDEVADRRLKEVMRALSHFVPQLALPKRFDTAAADAALGATAPSPRSYWARMVAHLSGGGRSTIQPAAA